MSALEKLEELEMLISEWRKRQNWTTREEVCSFLFRSSDFLPSLIAALEMIEEKAKEVTCEDIFDRPHPADAVSSFARELLTRLGGEK